MLHIFLVTTESIRGAIAVEHDTPSGMDGCLVPCDGGWECRLLASPDLAACVCFRGVLGFIQATPVESLATLDEESGAGGGDSIPDRGPPESVYRDLYYRK